jgi:small-conductance mechanosensitive channel
MAHTASWRNFRRMQMSTFAAASLIYAGAVIYAWRTLPGDDHVKLIRTILLPVSFLLLSWLLPLLIGPVRRGLSRYVWLSYVSGFGQTVISVLTGIGVLLLLAGFIYWQVAAVAHGGRYPAGVFSGYAAGIGILLAQTLLGRGIERDPAIQPLIEVPET